MTRYVFLLLLISGFSFGQEICNNQIDDDHDGLVDGQDKLDCPCVIQPDNTPSLIPNPSFEILDSLPEQFSELSCAQSWQQATNATSDLFTEGSYMFSHFPDPIDGKSFAGTIIFVDYQEYLGACLLEKMQAGESYTLIFDIASSSINNVNPSCDASEIIPFEITLYGNPDCASFPLNTMGCPAISGFSALGSAIYTPSPGWSKVHISFTASQDINSIILGAPCTLPNDFSASCYDYFLWDNLELKAGKEEALYYVPNTFTPDDNELNQRFEPVFTCGFDPFDYEFKVYSRWGENVFTSHDSRIGWDGTVAGEMMQDGLYSWVIRYKAPYTDETTVISGHVALLR